MKLRELFTKNNARRAAIWLIDLLLGWNKWHVLALLVALVVAVYLMNRDEAQQNYLGLYKTPYTEAQLVEAEKHIEAVICIGRESMAREWKKRVCTEFSDKSIAEHCTGFVDALAGCHKVPTIGDVVFGDSTVVLGIQAREDVWDHERSHARDIYLEGVRPADTFLHLTTCIPREIEETEKAPPATCLKSWPPR